VRDQKVNELALVKPGRRVEQFLVFELLVAGAGDQRGLHDGFVANNGQQASADLQLVQQGLWHGLHRASQQDGVKWRLAAQALYAIALLYVCIGDAGLAQVLACSGNQVVAAVQRNNALRFVSQQGCDVAGAHADLQHGIVFAQVQVLNQAGFNAGCQQGATVGQGNFQIHEGQAAVCFGHEVFTTNGRQQRQHGCIEYIPGTDLLFDHVEAGLFDVHAVILGCKRECKRKTEILWRSEALCGSLRCCFGAGVQKALSQVTRARWFGVFQGLVRAARSGFG
jgi:hypothetical protein